MPFRPPLWALAVLALGCTLATADPPRDFGVPAMPPDPIDAFAAVLDLREAVGGKGDFAALLDDAAATGCNAVLCGYTPERLELCRERGLRLMIDLVGADADIRRPEHRDRLRAMCEKLPGDRAVWGYNLWNGPFDRFAPGGVDAINETLALVRSWDVMHPVWVGTDVTAGLDDVQGTAGVLASCDDPWKRGADTDGPTLAALSRMLRMRVDHLGRWLHPHDDVRQTMHTANTSIVCGMKAMILPPAPAGAAGAKHPCAAVCAALKPLYGDLAAMDMPRQVYSTATTRTSDDRPKEPGVPGGFEPFPATSWVQVTTGEALVGLFGYDEGWQALYVANHSAVRPQTVTLRVRAAGATEPGAETLDRATAEWRRLEVRDGAFTLELPPGGGELVRLGGVAGD